MKKFPKNFLWGTATSAYQIEGGGHNDWSEWEKSPQRLKNLEKKGLIEKYGKENFISGQSCNHWNLFKEDFKLAKELGNNAIRISLEWSKIESKEGEFNEEAINHYQEVIDYLHLLNIEPFITLWHWPIPVWMRDKRGWESKEIRKYFTRYVDKISSIFGDKINFWITINEPTAYSAASYLSGDWPPQKNNIFSFLKVSNNLAKAHKESYKIIKRNSPKSQIGIAENNSFFELEKNNFVNRIIKKIAEYFFNYRFLDKIKDYQDFIGLNYYFRNKVNLGIKFGFIRGEIENNKVSDLGWDLYPEGIYNVLRDLNKRYKKPIYITENGLADREDKCKYFPIQE